MRTPEYAPLRSPPRVSLFWGVGLASVYHSRSDIFPYSGTSWSSLCYLWPMIDFWKVLTFVFRSHRRRQCWCQVNWRWIPLSEVAMKALVQMLESGLLACLHKMSKRIVWAHPRPSQTLRRMVTLRKREREREREIIKLTMSSPYVLLQ